MCLGLPMRVLETDGLSALVERNGERRRVSLLLVGDQPLGTPVLVHIDTAVRVLDEPEVPLIENALRAVEAAARGDDFEHLVGDLINRTPQLPPHLAAGGDKP